MHAVSISFLLLFSLLGALGSICQTQSPFHIIPEPKEISLSRGLFVLNHETKILASPACEKEALLFVSWLNKATKGSFKLTAYNELPETNFIIIHASETVSTFQNDALKAIPISTKKNGYPEKNEGYRMIADSKAIIINAPTNAGAYYALQTLRQILPHSSENGTLSLPYQISGFRMVDEPKFAHRGLLLDCSRHFQDINSIKKHIDALALYKMNVLHWHLTDDQGWRIEIKKYPELTNVGSKRINADGTHHNGYYTQTEIKELVEYAADRHVSIIPEIELPGHCVAALAAYPHLSCTGDKLEVENEWGVFKDIFCAGNEDTFLFLENVLSEVCELFPTPYIHIGGDEVPHYRWEHCAKCSKRMETEKLTTYGELQHYFTSRIGTFLKSKNKRIIGWDEILHNDMPEHAIIQVWNNAQLAVLAAEQNTNVIMSPTSHCYLDYPLTSIDLEKVYSFDPIPEGMTSHLHYKVVGAEGNMWSEHAPQSLIDQKIYPRILALSEVLWTYPEQRNYTAFLNKVLQHYTRLEHTGITMGFPTIPASYTIKTLQPNRVQLIIDKTFEGPEIHITLQSKNKKAEAITLKKESQNLDLMIAESTQIQLSATLAKSNFDPPMTLNITPHLATGAACELNYTPHPNYTGGGNNALCNGLLGTSSFRDGHWQAIQGKDMEVIIDLSTTREIQSISTNWYHYSNAWIFRPDSVEYYISEDRKKWTPVAAIQLEAPMQTPGESIIPAEQTFAPSKGRYIKMQAKNAGKCPEWHDAAGENSWLFCDEIVVR